MINVSLEEDEITDFADALEHSGCAQRLVSLHFPSCYLTPERLQAVVGLLGHGGFPALKELDFSGNRDMRDEEVVSLAEALMGATKTRLWNLNLNNWLMGDEGIAALASVVSQGYFEELRKLSFSHNGDITDEGMTALARAIDVRGLPMLETFAMEGLDLMTNRGVGAITDVLIKRCLQLATIVWGHWGLSNKDKVRDMLKTAGRGNVKVIHMDSCLVELSDYDSDSTDSTNS